MPARVRGNSTAKVLQASRSLPKQRRSNPPPALTAAIFDVDGVLLASPHERAWREALQGFADPENFTSTMYQAHVAGKPYPSGGAFNYPQFPFWSEQRHLNKT